MHLPNHKENHRILSKKAFEVSYALFRIAAHIDRRSFASHIEEHGLRLLGAATGRDYEEAKRAISGIEYFMILASDASLVKSDVCNFLIDEVRKLNSAIAELESLPVLAEIDISGVFSPMPQIVKEPQAISVVQRLDSAKELGSFREEGQSQKNTQGIQPGSEIRQSAILEKIRQKGSCRMKDILELFPDSSERTIRYDLQGLVESGEIEKIGVSGPATYYQARVS